jgi:hypothetical protein
MASSGSVALIALSGVCLAQAVVIGMDFRRSRREDSRRWHADRRQIYAEFVACAYNIIEFLRANWTSRRSDDGLERLRDELVLHMQKIQLTASEPVVRAAVNHRDTILRMIDAHLSDGGSTSFGEARLKTMPSNVEFVLHARRELGVATKSKLRHGDLYSWIRWT